MVNTILNLYLFSQMDSLEIKKEEDYQVDIFILHIYVLPIIFALAIMDPNPVLPLLLYRWNPLKSRMMKNIR
jgi:hypothetical protein